MKIIVGLGNPGNKYQNTRHNAGFMALDFYLSTHKAIKCESKFEGYICEMHFTAGGTNQAPVKTFFVKPQTYMNKSGVAIKQISSFYKIDPSQDLLVIHDEIDLKFGYYKLAFDSRAAGHNGVKNIVEEMGTQEFHRVRIGVESRMSRFDSKTEDFVLQDFTSEELATLHETVFPKINTEIENFIISP